MNMRYELILLITFFLAFFNFKGAALAHAGQGDSPSHLGKEQLPEPFSKASEQADVAQQNRFDGALHQCYYRDQPVLPKSKRVIGPLSRLHRLCNSEAFMRDIVPKNERRPHRGRRLRHASEDREAQDERVESAASELIDSDYSEARDGLYTVLTKTKGKPACNYATADSAVPQTACPTFPIADLSSMSLGPADIVSILYDGMRNRRLADLSNNNPDRTLSYAGRYFLKSRGFERFLAGWKRNDGNARYHVSQDDVKRIRDKVIIGTPFYELSTTDKQLFGKLAFVRNMLEIYGTIRTVMKPLGLASNQRRTAKEFLQAMYGYVMAVHKSDGKLALESSVTMSFISADLFNFAYAGCYPLNVTSVSNHGDDGIKRFLDKRRHLYVEGMIILFKAWCESAKNYIDPAVLSTVTDTFYSFIKPSENYDDGCQQRVRN
ncbi:hypothetical protein PAPHI01_2008 [Pancytospora philotis]|nr:hypothetical protein PAPHI01_2008 [Pancytospora philotis]